jgi:hypothetical protein
MQNNRETEETMAKELVVEVNTKKTKVKFTKDCFVKGQLVRAGNLLSVPKDDALEVIGAGKGREARDGDDHVEPADDAPAKGGKKGKEALPADDGDKK